MRFDYRELGELGLLLIGFAVTMWYWFSTQGTGSAFEKTVVTLFYLCFMILMGIFFQLKKRL